MPIVLLSGSPSERSSTDAVLRWLAGLIEARGFSTVLVSVRDLSPQALFEADLGEPGIRALIGQLGQAQGVVVASPVYKASYSGVLKALVDLFPENLLKNVPTLPLMVGGSPNHFLAVDWALRPLLTLLKAQTLQGVYVLSEQVDKGAPIPLSEPELSHRVVDQVDQLFALVKIWQQSAPVPARA